MKLKLATCFLIAWSSLLSATEPYIPLWNGLLSRYTRIDTKKNIQTRLLDYAALKNDPVFQIMLENLNTINPDQFKTDIEKEAFWINAYNIAATKLALDGYPLSSILERGTFIFRHAFDVQVLAINKKVYTLREIENQLNKFQDPSIKYALCTATLSAPDLGKEAYVHFKLSRQLATAKTQYTTNPTKGEKAQYSWQLNATSDIKK